MGSQHPLSVNRSSGWHYPKTLKAIIKPLMLQLSQRSDYNLWMIFPIFPQRPAAYAARGPDFLLLTPPDLEQSSASL
jgi:hypothetical protein